MGFFKNTQVAEFKTIEPGRIPMPGKIWKCTPVGFSSPWNTPRLFLSVSQTRHCLIDCTECVFYELCTNFEIYKKPNEEQKLPTCNYPGEYLVFVDPFDPKYKDLVGEKPY